MSTTITAPETGRPVNGYIVIAPLSKESRAVIYELQDAIQARFPDNSFWFPRGEQLHITFAHIITPNVAYPDEPIQLWEQIGNQAVTALRQITPQPLAVDISFDAIQASPQAISLKGHDDGTYQRLRDRFVENFALPEASRRPPAIIHTTIARFYDQIALEDVQECVAQLHPNFVEITQELQIIHETGLYVHDHDVLERIRGER